MGIVRIPFMTGLVFALLLLSSCGPDYIFEETHEISEAGWAWSDTVNYTFEIPDTSTIYNLHLVVDHKDYFPNQNTYVRLKLAFPDGQRTNEQLSLQLADGIGTWLANCRGEDCSLDIPIQEGAFFDQAGTYTLTLEQFSRTEVLEGISALTFAIEKYVD
ncbi:MAG: gliding motility lipoprotein GldH [Bacteroidota bacterium]